MNIWLYNTKKKCLTTNHTLKGLRHRQQYIVWIRNRQTLDVVEFKHQSTQDALQLDKVIVISTVGQVQLW